ncbi:MAG: hypothetical protein ACREQJ_11015, partial [Candidatus Binatia bacterium]
METDAAITPRIAASLRGLDARWFTTVLREAGYVDATVTAVRMEPMAFTGAVADMARVRLGYEDPRSAGPATLVAKIRGADEMRLAMDSAMSLYEREARFYAQFANRVPLRTPRCFHVGDGTSGPLLLEDLGELRAGDQMRGLGLADAARLIDVLADLHGSFW